MNRATIESIRASQETPPGPEDCSRSRRRAVTHRFLPGLCCLLLLLVTMSVGQRAAAQTVKFNSPVTYPAGTPYVVASGDFNGDGKMDLVAGDINHNDLLMLLGNGDGTLKPAVTYHLAAAPYYIIANDFNRDGKLDLAIGFFNAANTGILFGKGDGSFEAPVNYAVGGAHILAADFNRDGRPDLAVPANGGVNVLLGSGNGAFQNPRSYGFAQTPILLAAGDCNGDGRVDLIGVVRSTKTVGVLLGNADGTFPTPINSSYDGAVNGSGPYSIAVGDFDRDGKLDVALTDENLKILKGNGDGTFKAPSFTFHLNNTSVDLKVTDFNGDGKLDLVSAGVFQGSNLQVLLGNGDGTFQHAGDLINNVGGVSVVVADLNGDTRPDLAACVNSQLAVALVNATPGDPDNTDYFVHQHYVDFLDREPDASGFGFWTNEITLCGSDAQCVGVKRVNVSAAYYLSIEFQQTGYLVERIYKAAYGDAIGTSTLNGTHQLPVPVVRFNEFLADTQKIGEGVVVLQTGWEQLLENNKQAFASEFVQRSRFTAALPTSMMPAQFVDNLNANTGNVLSASERSTAIALFGGATDTSNVAARAQALRLVAEDQDLYSAEFNRALVLMQYFGYLRRDPNSGRDSDFSGYDFWLNKLNQFNGNFANAEMVKAFITSGEYRTRFGP